MDQKFEEYLKILENSNYQGGTYILNKNASSLEKSKYELCQKMLTYYKKNKLTIEQMAKKIRLSEAETDEILRCWIDKFTLDRLVSYANNLSANLELRVTGI